MPTQINGSTGVSKVQDGVVTQADLASNVAGNGPAFSAYLSASPQTVTASAATKVTFDNEEFDTHAAFSNGRFTPQVAGYYQVNWAVRVNSSTSTMTEARTTLSKNGADVRAAPYETVPNSSRIQSAGSAFVYMNGTTDYLEVFVVGIGGGTLTLTNALSTTNFSGFLARAA